MCVPTEDSELASAGPYQDHLHATTWLPAEPVSVATYDYPETDWSRIEARVAEAAGLSVLPEPIPDAPFAGEAEPGDLAPTDVPEHVHDGSRYASVG